MISQNSVNPNCKLEIVLEPCENIKPVYKTEGNKDGTLSQRGGSLVYSNREMKTYPKVEIKNYRPTEKPGEEIFIQCSLSTVDEDKGPHFHALTRAISRYEEEEELIKIKVNKSKQITFSNLKITWTKKKDRLSMFKRKHCKYYREQSELSDAEYDKYLDARIKTINCDEMCLKFEAFVEIKGGKDKHCVCDPVFSRIIKKCGKQNANVDKKRRRKPCSATVEESKDCSGKKQCCRTNACKNDNLGEARQSRDLKLTNESNLHNKVVLHQRATPNAAELQGQVLFARTQDCAQEILMNESIRPPSEIADSNLLSSPCIDNERSYLLPEYIDNLPNLNVDDQDFEYPSCQASDDFVRPQSLTVIEELYTDTSGVLKGFSRESSGEIEGVFQEMSSILKDFPDGMPNLWSTLKTCSEIADFEIHANSGLGGVFRVLQRLWDQTNIYIILLAVLLITVYQMRYGAYGFFFLFGYFFLLLNLRRRNHLYLNKLCNGLRTITYVCFGILVHLLCYTLLKLVVWILVKVIQSRIISSEKKVKCVLTFLNLSLGDHFSGQGFDDRFRSYPSRKEKSSVKVSKRMELIELLRKKIHLFKNVHPYNLQISRFMVVWFILVVHLILYSFNIY